MELKEEKKEKAKLQNDILLIEARSRQDMLTRRQDKRLVAKLAKLQSALEGKKTDPVRTCLANFEHKWSTSKKKCFHKLTSLPEKVSIIDLLQGKPMSRCDL